MANDPIQPDDAPSGDPHDREAREWLANVYQGDTVRQLSVRSIITGMLIGAVMSISNLYVGLKTGWNLTVTITACIIAYSVFKTLEGIFPRFRRDPFTILENYTMSSAASAAGYISSAGLVSAFPALWLTSQIELKWWEMMTWLGAISVLGVFLAVPLKRQLINIEKLPFPSGIATAETLKSMHSRGTEALQKARALFWSALIGVGVKLWHEVPPMLAEWLKEAHAQAAEWLTALTLPDQLPLVPFSALAGRWLKRFSIGFEGSAVLLAAGAIMGLRVGVSLVVGAVIYFGIIGNLLLEHHVQFDGKPLEEGYPGLVRWTVWPATSLMVTSGLLAFALRWRTIVRAFRGLAAAFGGGPREASPLDRIEVPGSWFAAGTFVSGLACVVLGYFLFHITWWMGVIAVLVSFVLSIVAARATGETDITPIGAMGKITQLLYGVLAPSNIVTNLMTATVTAGAASHSADLLTDLKSGYMLGGNPRKQLISQLFGVLAGTLVCVPVYAIVVDPKKLGTTELPAPAAKVWAVVAQLVAKGIGSLPEWAPTAMLVAAILGVIITLADEFSPQRYRKWIPSATGLGIAGVVSASNSIAMCIGALVAWLLAKYSPRLDVKYTIAVSSGLIAGESLTGVTLNLIQAAPATWHRIWSHLHG